MVRQPTGTPTVFLLGDTAGKTARGLLPPSSIPDASITACGTMSEIGQPAPIPACLVAAVRTEAAAQAAVAEAFARTVCMPLLLVLPRPKVAFAVAAVRNGAFDVIDEAEAALRLPDSIRAALLQDQAARIPKEHALLARRRLAALSARERQVIDLLLEGNPSKVIGIRIGLSRKTIENYRANIMRKMHAGSIPQLVQAVLQGRQGAENEWNGKTPLYSRVGLHSM